LTVKLHLIALALAITSVLPGAASANGGHTAGNPTVSYGSGMKDSGTWANWSEWYEACTEFKPLGRHVARYSYHLRGDRSCGAWAECNVSRVSPEQVCVAFRMQGRDTNQGWLGVGNPNSGVRQSELVIAAELY
jgi:hypothetical protein